MHYKKLIIRLFIGVWASILFVHDALAQTQAQLTASHSASASPEKTLSLPLSKNGLSDQLVVQYDPYEPFNRKMYVFNDELDTYLLKPAARVYNAIIPNVVNKGINNFFNNFDLFPTVFNDILQGKLQQTLNDAWRLLVNSTLGLGGLFDVASKIQLRAHYTDFGLTLAKWGYINSNYLILPFFGPSTVRDGVGLPVDYFIFSPYPRIPRNARYLLYGTRVVSRRAALLNYQTVFDAVALDKYVFMRNAYLQRRAYQMNAQE